MTTSIYVYVYSLRRNDATGINGTVAYKRERSDQKPNAIVRIRVKRSVPGHTLCGRVCVFGECNVIRTNSECKLFQSFTCSNYTENGYRYSGPPPGRVVNFVNGVGGKYKIGGRRNNSADVEFYSANPERTLSIREIRNGTIIFPRVKPVARSGNGGVDIGETKKVYPLNLSGRDFFFFFWGGLAKIPYTFRNVNYRNIYT